jgi:hypothetical protein
MSVVGDVLIIIKDQKVMGGQLPVGCKDYHNQKKTYNQFRARMLFYSIHHKRIPS